MLDSNGTVLFNWFNEFGIVQPTEVVFNFANLQSEYVSSGIAALRPAVQPDRPQHEARRPRGHGSRAAAALSRYAAMRSSTR